MLFSRPKRIGKLIREGDEAQRRKDWRTAYRCYSEIVATRPERAEFWVQLGHVAKELGETDRAEQAYREALSRGGEHTDTYVQLGHLLKQQGARDGAIAAYADALRLDPDAAAPLQELVSLGARDAVPDAVFALPRRDRILAELAARIGDVDHLLDRQTAAATFPLRSYDMFRSAYPVPPPPASTSLDMSILIDARDTSPAYLRATLVSLLDQSVGNWHAKVRAAPGLRDHPVASFAFTDSRITFVEPDAVIDPGRSEWLLSVSSGVLLDPQCLAWFVFAASIADGAKAIHADHDHVLDDPVAGRTRARPALYGAFDPYVLAQTSMSPPVVMLRADALAEGGEAFSRPVAEVHRRLLLAVAERGAIAHVPRMLASIVELPDMVRGAPQEAGNAMAIAGVTGGAPAIGARFTVGHGDLELRAGPGSDPVAVAVSTVADDVAIRVVIPTRDAAGMLRTAVDCLLDRAAHRERVRLTIVDNRSTDSETLALLDAYRRRGIDILVMDEPFNWSRANNLAAAKSDEPILVFVNNDTEMQTAGWDGLVTGYLQRDDVGVVGARLLYPDRTLQHGGAMFFGGSPRHEGVGVAAEVSGPLGRWAATRAVGAVTGAFLAVRRDRFDAVGGFDEKRLAIAFNDIDFCLKIRSHGQVILYAAAIELIHHESKTRGMNDTRAKVAWDIDEFRTLRERWGDALAYDPGYNPQWSGGPIPFDGLREPPLRDIVRQIERSSDRHPWQVGSLPSA